MSNHSVCVCVCVCVCVERVLIGSSDLIVSRCDVWVTLSVTHKLHARMKERRSVNTQQRRHHHPMAQGRAQRTRGPSLRDRRWLGRTAICSTFPAALGPSLALWPCGTHTKADINQSRRIAYCKGKLRVRCCSVVEGYYTCSNASPTPSQAGSRSLVYRANEEIN